MDWLGSDSIWGLYIMERTLNYRKNVHIVRYVYVLHDVK